MKMPRKVKLKKYRVVGEVTVSVYTEVMATSPKNAMIEAQDRGTQQFCHSCTSQDSSDQWVTTGELDGEPKPVSAEEVEEE